jgi:trehalose-6-phosphate synthase
MSTEEESSRMRRMRASVREHNVYRWAANLLSDLTDIRIDAPDRIEAGESIGR